jgi:hypothetical protein
MARTISVVVYQTVVADLHHNGHHYYCTRKVANRNRDGALVFEFACKVEAGPGERFGRELRLWARADGSEIEED